jgi:hypothetical protein
VFGVGMPLNKLHKHLVTLKRCIVCPSNHCLFKGIFIRYTLGCTGCIFYCFLEVSRWWASILA